MADGETDRVIRLGRFQIGLNVLVQLSLAVLILLMVNYINTRRHKNWDLSQNTQFTLSDKTLQVIGGLDRDVRLYVAFRRDSDVTAYVERMVQQYVEQSGARVQATFFDPELDANTSAEVSNKFNKLPLNENIIIVDPAEGKMQLVLERNIVDRQTNDPLSRRILRFKLEPALTGAIIAATESKQSKLYLVDDKGTLPTDERGDDAAGVLATHCRTQNTAVHALKLGGALKIPGDASGVVLMNPSVDLTESEIGILRDYWENHQGALLIMLNPQYHNDLPKLNAFLRNFGVFPEDNRVIRNLPRADGTYGKQFIVHAEFISGDPTTDKLERVGTDFTGQSMALDVKENDTIFKSQNIRLKSLIRASPSLSAMSPDGYWGETQYSLPVAKPDPGVDITGNVILAASIEKGAGGDKRLSVNSSRMVVIGNSSLLFPGTLSAPNLNFVLNSVNWMIDREELIGIPPKEAGFFRINITEENAQLLKNITVWLLPAVVLLLGAIVTFLRRR